MEPLHVNIWAVLLSTVVSTILGIFWYSPNVLGSVWVKEHGFAEQQLKPSIINYLGALLINFVLAYVLNMLIHTFHVTGLANGLGLGFFIWLGFIATTHFSGVLWAKKPFVVFFIDAGFYLVNLLIISSIMTLWQ
jgi:Protein of unknown function (DUF1761)